MKKILISFMMAFALCIGVHAGDNDIELTGGTAASKLSKDKLSGAFTVTGGEFQTIFQAENISVKGSKKVKIEFENPTTIPLVFEFKTSNVGKPNEVIRGVTFEKGTKVGYAEIPEDYKKDMPYMHVIHMGYDDTLVPGEDAVIKVKSVSLTK